MANSCSSTLPRRGWPKRYYSINTEGFAEFRNQFAEDDDVVQALPADRADEAFEVPMWIGIGV
jgi:hypothetical protein